MSSKQKDSSTCADWIRSFDFYKDLPQDLAQPTFSGASISMVFVVLMGILFVSETVNFLTPHKTSEIVIDVSKGNEKLNININVLFPKTPCHILSLDVVDVTGVHVVDVEGTVHKHQLSSTGEIIGSENIFERDHEAVIS